MTHPIITEIINKKKPVFFISPHFDDAVLSSGALLSFLAKKTSVTVVNVFTKARANPTTLSARQFLRQCGYDNALTLFSDRAKEDAVVLKNISHKVINLGHTDALWREKYHTDLISFFFPFVPEAKTLYPTYRFHISKGRVVKADDMLIEQIKQELQNIIEKEAFIFCPFGIGKHVDHLITKKACDKLDRQRIYWADFPYSEKFSISKDIMFSFDENLEEKEKLVRGYKTQYQALFPHGFLRKPEVFFVS